MPVTFFSQVAIHAILQQNFYVIENPAHHRNNIVAACTCVSQTDNSLLLVSSRGYFRHYALTSPRSCLPPSVFTASSAKYPNVPNRAVKLKTAFGNVISVSTLKPQCKPTSINSECDCQLAICAANAYLEFSFHSMRVTSSFSWPHPRDSISHIISLPSGPLRQACAPHSSHTSAVIATSSNGTVYATYGFRLLSVVRYLALQKPSSDVINLFQSPVICRADSAGCFVLIIGSYGSGVVLYPNIHGRLVPKRFLLLTPPSRLTSASLVIRHCRNFHLTIEHLPTTHTVTVDYDCQTSKLTVVQNKPNPFCSAASQQLSSCETTLRSLLRGIEDVSKQHAHADVESLSLQRLVSSYNSALLFVLEWNQRDDANQVSRKLARNCSVSIQTVAAPDSPLFNAPIPLAGRRCFLTVKFCNCTGIAMSHGWTLHVRLSPIPLKANHRRKAGVGVDTFVGSKSPSSHEDATIIAKEMHAPLGEVVPDEHVTISFPLTVDSHAPFYVSVALQFRHPLAMQNVLRDAFNVSVDVLNDVIIDIFDLAYTCDTPRDQDASHRHLRNWSLSHYFDDSGKDDRLTPPSLSRFDLPFPLSELRQVLGFSSQRADACFRSIIGAQYSVMLTESSPPGENHAAGNSTTAVAIHAVPHVAPFVRCAILRRVMSSLSAKDDDGNLTVPKLTLPKVVVQGGGNIERWQRGIMDATDETLTFLRKAETALVDVMNAYEDAECEHTGTFSCRQGREREALYRCVSAASTVYKEWRRKTETVWSLPGGTITPSSL